MKKLKSALESGQKKSIEVDVSNTDRAFGTIFGSEITKRYGDDLEEDSYVIKCKGAGGQSFGAFIPRGLTLELDRRFQRLLRQGPVRRQADRLSAQGCALQAG